MSSRLRPLAATLVLTIATTGCLQLQRGYQQEMETAQYIPESVARSMQNENNQVDLLSRSVEGAFRPWGFWDSLDRGWRADVEYWRR